MEEITATLRAHIDSICPNCGAQDDISINIGDIDDEGNSDIIIQCPICNEIYKITKVID